MNSKKLIGSIIGVAAFILLIAGATFAWLTVTANVTNATLTGVSKNFVIDYQGGSAVGGLNQISNGSATTANITSAQLASTTGDGWLAVSASKANTSAKASSFEVKLHINTNELTSNSLMFAVCSGSEGCPEETVLASITSGSAVCASGVLNCGIIPGNSNTEVSLVTDTSTFNTLSSASETYHIYFWLNNDSMVNADMGANFAGYIYAKATQGE